MRQKLRCKVCRDPGGRPGRVDVIMLGIPEPDQVVEEAAGAAGVRVKRGRVVPVPLDNSIRWSGSFVVLVDQSTQDAMSPNPVGVKVLSRARTRRDGAQARARSFMRLGDIR